MLVLKTFKNSIASNHKEVKIVLQFETANLGVAHDNVRISTIFLQLSLDVSEGARHGQATWECSQRTLDV